MKHKNSNMTSSVEALYRTVLFLPGHVSSCPFATLRYFFSLARSVPRQILKARLH